MAAARATRYRDRRVRGVIASVVICTYNRPRMLAGTVRSCLADATRRGTPYEIVIADNSVDGHAAPLVASLAGAPVPVRSVRAGPPNISIARNAGIAASVAPLVAFLDDDLVVEPGWLDALIDAIAGGADGAIGPVRPVFEGGAPAWDPAGARFTRVLHAPAGTPIVPSARTPGFVVSTATSIWRRDTCFTDASPFDPAFGASGGEDLDLFLRLERRGRRFVWCPGAGVQETIPAGRTAWRYQLLRAYSGAQVYTAAAVRHSDGPGRRAAGIMARGTAQAAIGLLRAAPAALRGRGLDAAFMIATGAGKLTWWRTLPLYHIERT